MENLNLKDALKMLNNALKIDAIDLDALANNIQKDAGRNIVVSNEVSHRLTLMMLKTTLVENYLTFLNLIAEYKTCRKNRVTGEKFESLMEIILFHISYYKTQNKIQLRNANKEISQGPENVLNYIEKLYTTVEDENAFISRNIDNVNCTEKAIIMALNNILIARKSIKAVMTIFGEKSMDMLKEQIALLYLEKKEAKQIENVNYSNLIEVLVGKAND